MLHTSKHSKSPHVLQPYRLTRLAGTGALLGYLRSGPTPGAAARGEPDPLRRGGRGRGSAVGGGGSDRGCGERAVRPGRPGPGPGPGPRLTMNAGGAARQPLGRQAAAGAASAQTRKTRSRHSRARAPHFRRESGIQFHNFGEKSGSVFSLTLAWSWPTGRAANQWLHGAHAMRHSATAGPFRCRHRAARA